VRLRVEEGLHPAHPVGGGPAEVGGGEVVEVGLGDEHVHRRVVHAEETRERIELVGGAHLVHGALTDVHPVPARQLELELRLEGALEVQVQFGLGQAGDEG